MEGYGNPPEKNFLRLFLGMSLMGGGSMLVSMYLYPQGGRLRGGLFVGLYVGALAWPKNPPAWLGGHEALCRACDSESGKHCHRRAVKGWRPLLRALHGGDGLWGQGSPAIEARAGLP